MILYRAVRVVFGLYLRLFRGFRVLGADRVPPTEPIIVCGNHVNWVDPVVLACSTPRAIYFMAKQELFEKSWLARIYAALGAFPVRRGAVDRTALRRCLGLLEGGHPVGIFPEGTRSRTGRLGPGEPGAAVIGLMTGAKICPVGITGYRSRELRVTWAEPIDPRQFGDPEARRSRQVVNSLTREIMARIAAVTGQSVHGEPSQGGDEPRA
jgi:1-acyl-sn-glycerol-3-phosphate acyltransferase